MKVIYFSESVRDGMTPGGMTPGGMTPGWGAETPRDTRFDDVKVLAK